MLHDEVIGTFNVESPEAAGVQRKRPAVPGDLRPRRGRGAEHAGTAGRREGQHGRRQRRGHPQRRGPAGRRHPERRRQRDGALHRPRAGSRRAAAADPAKRPRHQAGDPEGRPVDGPGRGPAARRPASSCGRRWWAAACWWSTPTTASAAPPTRCLERYGCIVETAHDGGEAQFMVRSLAHGQHYDAIIADIRLPDMTGYELMLKLKEMMEAVPMVLMTGFGYDPGHSIVKARQAGLQAVLYKPFRLDQLLETVEQIVTGKKPTLACVTVICCDSCMFPSPWRAGVRDGVTRLTPPSPALDGHPLAHVVRSCLVSRPSSATPSCGWRVSTAPRARDQAQVDGCAHRVVRAGAGLYAAGDRPGSVWQIWNERHDPLRMPWIVIWAYCSGSAIVACVVRAIQWLAATTWHAERRGARASPITRRASCA